MTGRLGFAEGREPSSETGKIQFRSMRCRVYDKLFKHPYGYISLGFDEKFVMVKNAAERRN
jgi:hypothetical protein